MLIIDSVEQQKLQFMIYNWQDENWPNFTYDLSDELQSVIYRYGLSASRLAGEFTQVNHDIKNETLIDLMVSEAIKTSAIEGEHFDDSDLRSSLQNQLGLLIRPVPVKDERTVSLAKLMIDSRKAFSAPLSEQMLFEWHRLIMTDPSSRDNSSVGCWRAEPIQIVSGAVGQERVHFEAPPPQRVSKEMADFIRWFNETDPNRGIIKINGPVRSALAHLYFESIHPFADGNGRIGRVLSEKALSQDLNSPILLSLSDTIHAKKKKYYQELSLSSTNGVIVTSWINYFVHVIFQAQSETEKKITHVLQKARFFDQYEADLNDRQKKAIHKMFDAGPSGFIGGMSAKKYVTITGCSKATATRDLSELLHKGCLQQLEEGGRSTRYKLAATKEY